jgi:hypothetical protein
MNPEDAVETTDFTGDTDNQGILCFLSFTWQVNPGLPGLFFNSLHPWNQCNPWSNELWNLK